MRPSKLPSLLINKETSSVSSKIKSTVKWIVYIISIVSIMSVLLFLNIRNEERLLLLHKVEIEQKSALVNNHGIVFDATTNIIKREGNVPEKVARQYALWIYESAAKYAIDPVLILSIMKVESNFNYKVVSSGNAVGLMQIISSYHKDKTTAAQLFNPEHNIKVGTQIIKEYSNRSSSQIETLLRYNGSLGSAGSYATKVLKTKMKFESEIMNSITM